MFNRKTYLQTLYPITVGLLILLIIVARVMWGYPLPNPEPYYDYWETISGLGDWEKSPIGFLFFQLWGLTIGIFILHITPYVHQHLKPYSNCKFQLFGKNILPKKLTGLHELRFGTFLLFMGAIGFILMGLIPADLIPDLHELSAGIGYGGVVFSAFFHMSIYEQARDRLNQKLRVAVFFLWLGLAVYAAITYGIGEFYYKELYDLGWYDYDWELAGVPRIYSFAITERLGFIVMIIYFGFIGYMLPDLPKDLKNNDLDHT